MTVGPVTRTDVASKEWAIDDNVVRLREWGAETGCLLPSLTDDRWTSEWTVGSGDTCALQLSDSSGLMSRLHARLVVTDGAYRLYDAGSTSGTWINYTPVAVETGQSLEHGDLINLGRVQLRFQRRDRPPPNGSGVRVQAVEPSNGTKKEAS